MVVNKPEIPDDDFCGIINPGCRPISAPVRDWSITLSPPKGPKTRKTLPKDGLPAQTELTKILQFTDVHLDLDYVPGTDSGCGLPACCRDGIPTNPDNSAGKWGHFSCEMPESGLKALYKHGANTHSVKSLPKNYHLCNFLPLHVLTIPVQKHFFIHNSLIGKNYSLFKI